MKKHWYLIVHRGGLKLFEQQGIESSFQLISEVEYPEGQLKNQELVSDKMGRAEPGYNTYAPERYPTERTLEKFAKEIACMLDRKVEVNAFESLDIIASPKTLGILKKVLTERTKDRLRQTVAKDLARASKKRITAYLSEICMHREPIESRHEAMKIV